MKKVLNVLSALALLVVILAAGVFGYSQFKEINTVKEEPKKEESKKEEKKENEEQTVEETTDVTQEQTTEEDNQTNENQSVEQSQQEVPSQEAPVQEDEPVTDNEGNNIDDMNTEEFMSKYTEGMDPEEKETTMDLLKENPGYEDYLRGQVTARQKGEGGVY